MIVQHVQPQREPRNTETMCKLIEYHKGLGVGMRMSHSFPKRFAYSNLRLKDKK